MSGGAGAPAQLTMQMWTRWLFLHSPVMLWTKFSKELKENVYLPYLCFLIKGLGGGASFYFR